MAPDIIGISVFGDLSKTDCDHKMLEQNKTTRITKKGDPFFFIDGILTQTFLQPKAYL
jgi:hypothetical protein